MNRRVRRKKTCRRPGRNRFIRLHSILKMGDM